MILFAMKGGDTGKQQRTGGLGSFCSWIGKDRQSVEYKTENQKTFAPGFPCSSFCLICVLGHSGEDICVKNYSSSKS